MSNFVAVIIVKTPFFSRFVPDAYSIKKRCKLGSLASSLGSVKAGVKVAVTLCSMKPKIKRKVFRSDEANKYYNVELASSECWS